MERNIIPWDSKILYEPTQPWDFGNPPEDINQIEADLKRVMTGMRGLGLSANQIGIPYSIFMMGNTYDPDNLKLIVNPTIVFKSQETIEMVEGCLSFPALQFKIYRPTTIRARYMNKDGKTSTDKYEGITSRVFQHEYAHLSGEAFFKGLSRLKIERGIKKANSLGSNYEYHQLHKYL